MKATLRTLTMISAMSIVLLLANCSKDPDPVPDDVIIGKWNITSVNATVTVGSQSLVDFYISYGMTPEDAQLFAEDTESDYEGTEGGTLEFKNGGTYSAFTFGNTNTGAWELSSDRKTLTMDKGTAQEYVFTIATLTSANLNMATDISDDSDGPTFDIHMVMELTK